MASTSAYLKHRQRVKDQEDLDWAAMQVEELTGERPNFNEPPENALDTLNENAPSDVAVPDIVEPLEEDGFVPATPEVIQQTTEEIGSVMSFIKSVATQGQEITDPAANAIREDLAQGAEEGFFEQAVKGIPQTAADLLETIETVNEATGGIAFSGEIAAITKAKLFLRELAGPKPESVSANLVREGVALAIPLVGFTKLLRGEKAIEQIAGSSLRENLTLAVKADFLTNLTVADPDNSLLKQWLDQTPQINGKDVKAYIDPNTNEKDAGRLLQKIRNAVVLTGVDVTAGVTIGMIGETVAKILGGYRANEFAKLKKGAKTDVQDIKNQVRTEEGFAVGKPEMMALPIDDGNLSDLGLTNSNSPLIGSRDFNALQKAGNKREFLGQKKIKVQPRYINSAHDIDRMLDAVEKGTFVKNRQPKKDDSGRFTHRFSGTLDQEPELIGPIPAKKAVDPKDLLSVNDPEFKQLGNIFHRPPSLNMTKKRARAALRILPLMERDLVQRAKVVNPDKMDNLLKAITRGIELESVDAINPASIKAFGLIKQMAEDFHQVGDIDGLKRLMKDPNGELQVMGGMGDVPFPAIKLGFMDEIEPTMADLYSFRKSAAANSALRSVVLGDRAEANRILKVWELPESFTPLKKGEKVRKLILTNGEIGGTKEYATYIKMGEGNSAVISKLVQETANKLGGNQGIRIWRQFMLDGLLSNPATLGMISASNLGMTLWELPKAALKLFASKSPVLGSGKIGLSETLAFYRAIPTSLGRAAKLSWRAFKETPEARFLGIPKPIDDLTTQQRHLDLELDEFQRFESTRGQNISAGQFNLDPEGFVGLGVDFYGYLFNTSGRAIGGVDMFQRYFWTDLEKEFQIALKVSSEAQIQKLTKEQIGIRTEFLRENPGPEILDKSIDRANYMTLMNELGTIGQAGQEAIRKFPPLIMATPFLKAPINGAKAAFNDIGGPISAKWRQQVRAGGALRDNAIATFAYSTMGVGWVTNELVKSGILTGPGPAEIGARKRWMEAGNVPYSVDVGLLFSGEFGEGKISIEKLDPVSHIISIWMLVAETYQNAEGRDAEEMVLETSFLTWEAIQDRTVLEGMQKFMKAINSGGNKGAFSDFLALWAPSALVPKSAFFRAEAQRVDNKRRTFRTAPGDPDVIELGEKLGLDGIISQETLTSYQEGINNIRRTIPYLSKDLPEKTTLMGKSYPNTVEGLPTYLYAMDQLTSMPIDRESKDPVDIVIAKNEMIFGDNPTFFRGSAPGLNISYSIPLTGLEKATLDELVAKRLKRFWPRTVVSKAFKAASGGDEGGKKAYLLADLNAARTAAKKELMARSSSQEEGSLKSRRNDEINRKRGLRRTPAKQVDSGFSAPVIPEEIKGNISNNQGSSQSINKLIAGGK